MDGVTDPMLADLRQTFNKKIPGGLTETADSRLQRTLSHYVNEVSRVQGTDNVPQQDILRLTYDSMAAWFRRNITQMISKPPAPAAAAVEERFESEVDPMEVFASIKAARSSTTPAAAPFRMPDLEQLDTKTREFPPPTNYVQQKDVVQPQQDVVKYREVEYNLVMNSTDRDWYHNTTTQNRYNFMIQFNTNYKPQGFGLQGNIQNRLRNIIRIEFIKAIVPVEGLSVVIPRDCSGSEIGTVTTPQSAFCSVLALPSINVLVDELQGNNYGTNNTIDKSLAICQYDATWRSDYRATTSRGYAVFIPKFMKAQRVYAPTPLSNLQTLSFRLQDPENQLLSDTPDSSSISSIVFSSSITGSCYSDVSGSPSNYIFIGTKTWFPLWAYSQLDRIVMQGISFTSGSEPAGGKALVDWLQGTSGHSVVGVAYTLNSSDPLQVKDGSNAAGYANWIILQNRSVDPTAGAIGLDYFTGASGTDVTLGEDLATFPSDYEKGGILNLSRQVQITLRIITREYDLTSSVRADNV